MATTRSQSSLCHFAVFPPKHQCCSYYSWTTLPPAQAQVNRPGRPQPYPTPQAQPEVIFMLFRLLLLSNGDDVSPTGWPSGICVSWRKLGSYREDYLGLATLFTITDSSEDVLLFLERTVIISTAHSSYTVIVKSTDRGIAFALFFDRWLHYNNWML